MKKKKVAFMYDFDKTLCTKDMQEYGFIPHLGMTPAEFWGNVSKQTQEKKMDSILSYLYYMVDCSRKQNKPIKEEDLNNLGRDICFFSGVTEWFDRINQYGREKGLEIEHYIISSGLKEIIEGTPIAKNFKMIYASQFHYDQQGYADWPSNAVNFTNKTQFLFRIHKGTLEIYDNKINEYTPEEDIYIPYERMLYFGDGLTDVPCMSLVLRYGGNSIAVYDNDHKAARKLHEENRVNFTALADYSEGSDLDIIVKNILESLSLKDSLAALQEKELQKLED